MARSSALGEFDIIQRYFKRASSRSQVDLGIGDDCAIVALEPHKRLVMSIDTAVAGRHFPNDASAYDIATRALCTSLSDLAAMGASPIGFTLALTLPEVDEHWLAEFSRGLFTIAEPFGCDLIGGDTTQGPLTVSIQVHGELADKALLRSQAQAGDTLFVTGTLGDGAAALAWLQSNSAGSALDASDTDYLHQRFYAPTAQISAGQQLLTLANSAIDISDGLLADAQHIATASGVDIEIAIEQLPLSNAAQAMAKLSASDDSRALQDQCWDWALSGGDDYQLLFSVPPKHLPELEQLINRGELVATAIGKVTAGEACVRALLYGEAYSGASEKGYEHFAS